jgi:molecular chaperone DnaK
MVRDAEANKEDDKKFHELVARATRPTSSCTHARGDQGARRQGAGQIGAIEAALSDLEKVMKGEDKDAIDSRIAALEAAANHAVRRGGRSAGPRRGSAGGRLHRRRRTTSSMPSSRK